MDTQVGEFLIRSGFLCRVALQEFKGRQRLDVRAFYEAPDGTWQPTTKGLNIAVDLLPEFTRLVTDAQRMAEEGGLIDPKDFNED